MKQGERSLSARVLSGSAWIILTQGAILLLVFLAQRVILSTLTKEANGTLFFERRMTDLIVGIIVDFGMNGIIIRKVAQQQDRAPQIISSAIAFRLVLWFVATFISVGYAFASGYAVLDVVIWSFYLLIAARTTMLRYAVEAPYRTSSRFHVIGLLGVTDAMLFTALVYWMRESLNPFTVICAYALSAIPGFTLLVLMDRGRYIRPSFVKWKEVVSLLKEAVPVISALALLSIHATLDTIILEAFGSQRDVGVLGAIYTSIGPFLVVLPQAVSLAVMPEIARMALGDTQRRRDAVHTVLRLLVVSAVMMVSLAGPCMPLFIQLVSGGRYAGETMQFYWFLWTAPLVAVMVFSQELTVAVGQQRYNVWMAVGLLAFTILFGFALIPMLHSFGAVLARLATVIAGAGISFVVLRRILDERIDLLFVVRCCVVVAASMGATTWLSANLNLGLAVACSLGVALLTSFAMGLLRFDDVRFLQGLRSRVA
ncbi:MAG: hypothetical protein NTX15_04450 [Candidatus Kapabacteria bacterium]|nr:hypothetical protein [Candidatus Kapabacteria bacterium]